MLIAQGTVLQAKRKKEKKDTRVSREREPRGDRVGLSPADGLVDRTPGPSPTLAARGPVLSLLGFDIFF